MPFYEYVCDSCGHQFEKLQSINAKPLSTCDKCGEAIRRIIFPSAIVYKGSGFYSTEYGNSRFNHPSDKSRKEKAASASADKGTDKSGKSGSKEKSPKEKCACDSSSTDVKSSKPSSDSKSTKTSSPKASSSSGS